MLTTTNEARPLTWHHLVKLCPTLLDLERDLQAEDGDPTDTWYCANEVWSRKYKPRLSRLVGWDATTRAAILRSSEAYDVATDWLMEQLPACRNCGCL